MPDPLFGEDNQQQQQQSGDQDGQQQQQQQQTPTVDLSSLEKQVGDLNTNLRQVMTQFGAYVQQRDGQGDQQQQQQRPDGGDPNSYQERILTDPKSLLDDHFRDQARQTLGPTLASIVDSLHVQVTRDLRESFDREFGDGAFDTHIRPEYDESVQKLQPELKGVQGTMEALVNSIKGRKFADLREALTKVETDRKKKEDKEEALRGAPVMLTPGRGAPLPTKLSDEDLSLLERIEKKTGETLDQDRLLAVRGARDSDGRGGWTAEAMEPIVRPPKKETS